MEEKKKDSGFKKFRKITFRILLLLLILLLVTGIALTLPVVQTKIAHYFTEKINKQYGTNIEVEEVAITVFGGVKLKKVIIKDHHKDTLIYVKRINTSINDIEQLIEGQLVFGSIRADSLLLNVKNYKNEKDTNLDIFVASFDDGKKGSGKFLMTSKKIKITNSRFVLNDYNRKNPKDVDFTKLNADLTNFKIQGPNVTTAIQKMSFKDHRGLTVQNLKSKFAYTKKNIRLEELDLETAESNFKGDIILKYERKDFADFNNKVVFDINTEAAEIASNDIRYFYDELGKDQRFTLSGKIDGTLNNIKAKNLRLKDTRNSEIIGDVNFKNLFQKAGKGEFYMKGSFDKVSSNYDDLNKLLPNVLGKKLPSSLRKLGQFNLKGNAEITPRTIDADFDLATKLGNIKSKLVMSNIDTIDNASYSGTIALNKFDLGTFLNRKDFGIVTMNVDVDGKGFVEKNLNTKISGDLDNFYYNGYNYTNVTIDASFKKPIFNGKVNINDPNLFLDFDGIIDLSKKENVYDFHAKVDYANLHKLNLMNEKIAIFKGDVILKVSGSSINDVKGDILVTNASYQNSKDTYFFENVSVSSIFDQNRERIISFYSPNEVRGEIQGKFDFNQLYAVFQNSLGGLYRNYKPNPVKRGQYLKFNFTEFNKIIEILNPAISISDDAKINGSINADENDFKLNFTSNSIKTFDVAVDKVNIEIDNKNPLYNTYIEIDSLKTKNYKVSDFSLINVTSNDTLNFRTEFKGGDQAKDSYNLNVYHTFNEDKMNVVGFKKSEVFFKDFLWNINEKENEKNRIFFNKSFTNFSFDDVTLSHEDQSVVLSGLLNGKNDKDLKLVFDNVNIDKITPYVKKFSFEGLVDGEVNIKQVNSVYQPTSNLVINNLEVNDNLLGKMELEIEGDENFRKFNINSNVDNENFESFNAIGNLEMVNNETLIDLVLNFKKFDLGLLSKLSGEVFTNVRGAVTGSARLDGNVKNIDYNGRLFLDNAGLTIPYLNVDYELEENTIVDVTQNKFIIQQSKIFDTKFNTNGFINGFVKHRQFGNWELDLNINSRRLLALNTNDKDDAAYYGTAYINGLATITGPTDGLVINVEAKSEKGTDVKIPINDADAVDEKDYIRFITPKDKYNIADDTKVKEKNYNGLELNFEFDITPDANIEVILNRGSGHGMKGTGKGGLLFRINTLGKFEMYGDFVVDKGSYNFKYGGLIDKKFEVKENGYISWERDPFKAILDLQAVYKTTANPSVLVDNATFNKKVPVEVLIDLKGTISSPEPDFNINFPTVSSVLKSEIQTKLNDKDTRQQQALYLLSTGGFLSQDGLSQSQYTNFAYERASVLFSDIFNAQDDKLQLILDYVDPDRTPGKETDGRVGVSLSTKLSDRITVNGKVGVPVGGINESSVVGNFELEYRVNDDGTLNLRVFNRENDINYIGQGINYTQGLGLSYEVDFDTFNELMKNIFPKKKLKLLNKRTIDEDSEIKQNIPEPEPEKKKQEEKPKNNTEAIPVEE